MNTSKILFSLFLVLSLLVSCEKDNNHSEDDELATRMNQFIQSNLSTFYLWYDEIPNIKPESKKDPKEYFKALLSSKDKWSLITDDVNGLLEEMEGTGETYGYGLAYGRFSITAMNAFAVVQYVYPGSPAAEKLKRGDIIVKLNSQTSRKMTSTNSPSPEHSTGPGETSRGRHRSHGTNSHHHLTKDEHRSRSYHQTLRTGKS